MPQDEKQLGLGIASEAWDKHQSMVKMLGGHSPLSHYTMATWFRCCEGLVMSPPFSPPPACPTCKIRIWAAWVDWPIFKCMKCEKLHGAR